MAKNKVSKEKILGGLLGHIVGDALGVPAEFRSREEIRQNPITDMQPRMSFGDTVPVERHPAGTWSDDTSMTLALMDSLMAMGKYDSEDVMRRFSKWFNEGEYTPFGEAWDIGRTCREAIERYDNGTPADECGGKEEHNNGNGALMRILPMAFATVSQSELHRCVALTHAHRTNKMTCTVYWANLLDIKTRKFDKPNHRFVGEPAEGLKNTSYVVDTYRTAMSCFLTTGNYADCVLKAVNLGGDADTIAAVAGGLAGAYYGVNDIPQKWIDALQRKDYILDMCDRFAGESLKHPDNTLGGKF